MTTAAVDTTGLLGVGYEGQTLADVLDRLLAERVARVVDVRLNPISRRPGWSKNALRLALTDVGIAYDHRPELGNPRTNRAGFAGDDVELEAARAAFAKWISNPAAVEALDWLAACVQRERAAVLCYEADQARCHRDVVMAQVVQMCYRVG